ncbi:MAG: hypothetical protein CVU00_00055 [Bacteroidetes bacterium HGW-Bacteroidetes-17]|jgi:hypothetical protein|nr:MAG: hypothetical protein CVU00_00055 [Bacteroidetes bacterium HGW-Bacteroidetes-17]
MKRLFFLIIIFFCLYFISLQAQNLEEILKSHSKVMGFEKLKGIETITIIGENYLGTQKIPFKTIIKKPSKYYHERIFMGNEWIQVLDEDKAWSLNPMNGISDIYGSQLAILKKSREYGGILFKKEEKGLSVILDGTELIEEKKVFKLKVTDQDTLITDVLMDAKSFYIIKQSTKRVFQGDTITATILFSNYRVIDGIAVAFKTETISDKLIDEDESRKLGGGVMEIKSIEFNKPIDESIFIKPKKKW